MQSLIHLHLHYDEVDTVLKDLYQIAYKDAGTENLIEQLKKLNEIEEPLCTNCHYYIDNNCPIQDIMGSTYQCSYYERGK
jgi:uncharacterized protein (UPF0276 family)